MENSDVQGLSEINELKNAIADYSQTVLKCKNKNGLKNYHRSYLETLKKKAKRISENDLAKVQQLIPPGIGTDHNFNIYFFLYMKSKASPITIPIIDTLIISTSLNKTIFMNNNLSGNIQQITGSNAYNAFYSKLPMNLPDNDPICVYKPAEGKNILFSDIEKVKKFISNAHNLEGIFQKFVHTVDGHRYIIRLH